MMDVWLKLFSDKKPKFIPELNLHYRSKITTSFNDTYETKSKTGFQAGGQIWLTNLVSATTGLRTLNIDLGFSGGVEGTDLPYGLMLRDGSLAELQSKFQPQVNRAGVDLRILGDHSQDSSFMLGFGSERGSKIEGYGTSSEVLPTDYTGSYRSGELKLYLMNWLGIEGEVGSVSGTSTNSSEKLPFKRDYHRYGGFIEVSLMRFEYFIYQSKASFNNVDYFSSRSIITGLKIQI